MCLVPRFWCLTCSVVFSIDNFAFLKVNYYGCQTMRILQCLILGQLSRHLFLLPCHKNSVLFREIFSTGIIAFDLVHNMSCFRGSCRSFSDGNSLKAFTGLFETLTLRSFKSLAIGSAMHFLEVGSTIVKLKQIFS